MFARARALALRSKAHHRITPVKFIRKPISNDAPFPTYFQPPPPPPPPPRRRYVRIGLYVAVPFLLGYGAIYQFNNSVLGAVVLPAPGSQVDKLARDIWMGRLDKLDIVKQLREEQGWKEWDAYGNFSPAEATHRLTSGPMGGTRGVGVQRVFWNEEKKAAITVIRFGNGINGWIKLTHGGALATIMDESLGRVALRSFPAGTGVTANLNIDYRRGVRPDEWYYLTATAVEDKCSDRKATIVGRLEDSQGRVCVEATAVFVVPKHLTLRKITGEF